MKEYLELHKEEFKRWLTDNEQGRIDIKILPYLQDIDNGFFVEAGALDGLFMSNTKILEDLGWKGLLIEPSARAVKECRKNRNVPVEECALVSKNYTEDTVSGDFFFAGENGGLGAWSSINRDGYKVFHDGKEVKIQVKALTLGKVLNKYNITKVDLLSLDVEGYELEVLDGLDFDNVDIRYILMEVNLDSYSLDEANLFLEKKGYKNIACLSNFSTESNGGWNGLHQDYLYQKNG